MKYTSCCTFGGIAPCGMVIETFQMLSHNVPPFPSNTPRVVDGSRSGGKPNELPYGVEVAFGGPIGRLAWDVYCVSIDVLLIPIGPSSTGGGAVRLIIFEM